jgi:membrane-bound ClpP family serine protease
MRCEVADYTSVLVAVSVLAVILVIMMFRMFYTIQPGQLGLVFLLGLYVTTIQPGFSVVSPLANVRKVQPGTGANTILALTALTLSDMDPKGPPGEIRVGNRKVAARAQSRVKSGTNVTVIEDVTRGVVLVGIDRRTAWNQQGFKGSQPSDPSRM